MSLSVTFIRGGVAGGKDVEVIKKWHSFGSASFQIAMICKLKI